jgi:hypothetical protein
MLGSAPLLSRQGKMAGTVEGLLAGLQSKLRLTENGKKVMLPVHICRHSSVQDSDESLPTQAEVLFPGRHSGVWQSLPWRAQVSAARLSVSGSRHSVIGAACGSVKQEPNSELPRSIGCCISAHTARSCVCLAGAANQSPSCAVNEAVASLLG